MDDIIPRRVSVLRKADHLVLDIFKRLVVINEDGYVSKVPVIYGTKEKLQGVPRLRDNIVLPLVGLCRKDIHTVKYSGQAWLADYELTIWTFFQEDMNQILEQVMLPFNPSVSFEDRNVKRVNLEAIKYAESEERGDGMRILSYELFLQVEIYLGGANCPGA